MRLPIIKHVLGFIEENDEDWVVETIELLESMSEIITLKVEELASCSPIYTARSKFRK